jgi:GNAT superfamily N-acetyltransferase
MNNIRLVTKNDLNALGAAYVEAFRSVDPTEEWTSEQAIALLNFLLSAQPDLAFLVECDGKIGGGILGIVKPWWDGNHLVETELFLIPEFQSKGVGSRLFRHYLREATRVYDATIIESLTFKDLKFPLSWYVKLGFEVKSDWAVMFGKVRNLLHAVEDV